MNCSHTEDSLFYERSPIGGCFCALKRRWRSGPHGVLLLGELIAEQDMAIITEKSDFFIDIFEMSIDIL